MCVSKRGRVSYSTYGCANTLQIIRFEWLTQTNCETQVQQLGSTQVGCPRSIISQHSLNLQSDCVVYKDMGLIVRNAFAQRHTEYSLSLLLYTLGMSVCVCVCLQLLSNQSFYRHITGYRMSVGDHRVA